MEKNSTTFCSSKKQQRVNYITRNVKQTYDYYNLNKGSSSSSSSWDTFEHTTCFSPDGDSAAAAAGFSWPPRCYTCSFCKREFKSAQALGGHMNVHRRDRARLRQYSPTRDSNNNGNGGGGGGNQFSLLNLNHNPNPSSNPNPTSNPSLPPSPPPLSSLLTRFPQFASTLPPLCPPPNYAPVTKNDLTKTKSSNKGYFGNEKFDSSVSEKGCGVFKKGEFVRLDLEIGLISTQCNKEDLDLELRLGYI
ncbi:hypothetical protein ABFS82_07G043400 [Erythranthe guttata]